MKDAISRKKDAHKSVCRNRTEDDRNRYESMTNKARKVVSKALGELINCPN